MKIRIALAVAAIFSAGIVWDAEANHDIDGCSRHQWKAQDALYQVDQAIERRLKYALLGDQIGMDMVGTLDQWIKWQYAEFTRQKFELQTCVILKRGEEAEK